MPTLKGEGNMTKIEMKCKTRFEVLAVVKDMEDQLVTSLIYHDNIYYLQEPKKEKKPKVESYKDKPRKIEEWIKKNNINQFCISDFLKTVGKFPRCKIDATLSKMVQEEKLIQLGNEKFKVTNNFYEYMEKFK